MLKYALPLIAALYAFPALADDPNPAEVMQQQFDERHQATKAAEAPKLPPQPSLDDYASRMVMRLMVEREQLIEQIQQLQAQLKAR